METANRRPINSPSRKWGEILVARWQSPIGHAGRPAPRPGWRAASARNTAAGAPRPASRVTAPPPARQFLCRRHVCPDSHQQLCCIGLPDSTATSMAVLPSSSGRSSAVEPSRISVSMTSVCPFSAAQSALFVGPVERRAAESHQRLEHFRVPIRCCMGVQPCLSVWSSAVLPACRSQPRACSMRRSACELFRICLGRAPSRTSVSMAFACPFPAAT